MARRKSKPCSGRSKANCKTVKKCAWVGNRCRTSKRKGGRTKAGGRRPRTTGGHKCVWSARTHKCHLAKR